MASTASDAPPQHSVSINAITQRVTFENLPPDRQAEIIGQRQERAERRRNTYRPKAPAVLAPVEIHTPEIQLAYTRWFVACNEYAVAIDYVARERLTNRADYNRYLDEFDAALTEFAKVALALHTQYESLANGGKASSPAPSRIDARIQSKRSMQLLTLFRQCDDILRMISFLTLYGDLPDARAISDTGRIVNSLERCVKALRKVKVNCFRRIIEAEALTAKRPEAMTVEDLESARLIASRNGTTNTPSRVRKRTPGPVLDPSSPAEAPIPGVLEVEADTGSEEHGSIADHETPASSEA